MSDIIVKDGKPVFTGREDTVPVRPIQGSKMQCPVCHGDFDYLVGENTNDGGVQGCEGCWKPGKIKRGDESYDQGKEIA